ncbi:MAG: ion transporter [Pseudomonadota bacterium]|nr:ion transporter [Pseudomonadota bacterium]
MADTSAPVTFRVRARRFVDSNFFQRFILIIIMLNAVVLGLETSTAAMEAYGSWLIALDTLALSIFIAEILLKLYAMRLRYFRDPWNIFDFIIIAIALLPVSEGFSVLRALRVLRAFRLISMVPKMRLVVQAFLKAIPGMGSIMLLMMLVFYVFSVMATKLFGTVFDEWFGSVGASLYSLFQIMTLESWSMGIVRPVMEQFPLAWAFFIPFILVTTFAVLNLFIAIVVNSMQEVQEDEEHSQEERLELLTAIQALREEIAELRNKRSD